MFGSHLRLPWLDPSRRTLAILSQVYVPDPASVGQHLHDVAVEMVRRGFQVIVFTANRGYEDPNKRYEDYACVDMVHVVRLRWSSFGKSSIASRLIGGSAFLVQASAVAGMLPRLDNVLVSTSPPMAGVAGAVLRRWRGVPFMFWAMDLNPDQIVATGSFKATALPVRVFDQMNATTFRAAQHVVALDRFMAERLCSKHELRDKLTVMPPWPHVDTSQLPNPTAGMNFREAQGLADKLVVMYSGNLTPVHPVTTLLEAARRLKDYPQLTFVFVGAGLGRAEIESFYKQYSLENVRTLPYQKLSELSESLSAADVHLVSMGGPMVGIVHPCKIYGAMAVGRPILALGPRTSHIAEIVTKHDIGWHVEHGDIDGMVSVLRTIGRLPRRELLDMGKRAQRVAVDEFSRTELSHRFCDLLEDTTCGCQPATRQECRTI